MSNKYLLIAGKIWLINLASQKLEYRLVFYLMRYQTKNILDQTPVY